MPNDFVSLFVPQEQERAAKAEEQVQRLAAMHEERVANLEARLAELSLTVGSYDHLRQQDQNAISKLKVINQQVPFSFLKHSKNLI